MNDKSSESIVKYDNSFNRTSLSLLTAVQSDILMSVLERMGNSVSFDDEGNECYMARYTFKEIRTLINSKNMDAKKIKQVFDELLNTKVEFFEGNNYTKANLFSRYTLTGKSTSEIVLSPELTDKLVIEKNKYTILNLEEYVSLDTRYSKELYRLLRQFRHTGLLVIKKEDLKNALKPPKTYNEYTFIKRAVDRALEENQAYFKDLKISNMPKKGTTLPDVCKFTFVKHKKHKRRETINYNSKDHTAEELELLEHIRNHGGGK